MKNLDALYWHYLAVLPALKRSHAYLKACRSIVRTDDDLLWWILNVSDMIVRIGPLETNAVGMFFRNGIPRILETSNSGQTIQTSCFKMKQNENLTSITRHGDDLSETSQQDKSFRAPKREKRIKLLMIQEGLILGYQYRLRLSLVMLIGPFANNESNWVKYQSAYLPSLRTEFFWEKPLSIETDRN